LTESVAAVGEAEIERYLRNLHGEVDSAALHRALASAEG
jgi:hypothetical protein